jgi:hypothetical protein
LHAILDQCVNEHLDELVVSDEPPDDIALAMMGLTRIWPLCKDLIAVDQYDFSNTPDRVAAEISSHLEGKGIGRISR